MLTLRGYQEEAIARLRSNYQQGVRSQLLVSPTGSGKTVMFTAMTQSAMKRNKRIWICAHRVELLDQIGDTLGAFDVPFGEISPRAPATKHAVQVASVFSLVKRLDTMEAPDLIVFDEAHHCKANTWRRIFEKAANARFLGVTATPELPGGQGLADLFDVMVLGPTPAELIRQGSLSRYELFRPPSNLNLKGLVKRGGDWAIKDLDERVRGSTIMGDALSHYQTHCPDKRALAFCVSVKHAEEVAKAFRDGGIAATSIDGTTVPEIRKQAVKDLASGELKVLTSCDLISEGFDCPAVESAFLLRPTASLALYLQQCGRTLRVNEGKDRTLIFDHAGNSHKHGLPDDDRDWSLDGYAAKRAKQDTVAIRTCKSCYAIFRAPMIACPYCHTVMPVKDRQLDIQAGMLAKVDPEQARVEAKQARRQQGSTKTMEQLIALGRQRGYAHPQAWAYHVYTARKGR